MSLNEASCLMATCRKVKLFLKPKLWLLTDMLLIFEATSTSTTGTIFTAEAIDIRKSLWWTRGIGWWTRSRRWRIRNARNGRGDGRNSRRNARRRRRRKRKHRWRRRKRKLGRRIGGWIQSKHGLGSGGELWRSGKPDGGEAGQSSTTGKVFPRQTNQNLQFQ